MNDSTIVRPSLAWCGLIVAACSFASGEPNGQALAGRGFGPFPHAVVSPPVGAAPAPAGQHRPDDPEASAEPSATLTGATTEARPLGPVTRHSNVEPNVTVVPAGSRTASVAVGGLDIGRTAAALAGVIALALLIASAVKAVARRRGGVALALGPAGRAPSGVVHVLARYPLQRGQLLVLLKVGPRVLLVCQSRAGRIGSPAMHTLAEFSDPDEVASLVRLTWDSEGQSAASKFRAVLDRAGIEPTAGPVEPIAAPPPVRVVVASEGDRAEFSAAAGARAHGQRDARARGFAVPAAAPTLSASAALPRSGGERPASDLDGAEQLRRRLARLRAGHTEEAS